MLECVNCNTTIANNPGSSEELCDWCELISDLELEIYSFFMGLPRYQRRVIMAGLYVWYMSLSVSDWTTQQRNRLTAHLRRQAF